MSKTISIDKLKNELTDHVGALEDLIEEHLINEGDTCDDSQRMCLINALNQYYQCVVGIEVSDIKEEE